MRIGLIGFGAIGRNIARAVEAGQCGPQAEVAAILVTPRRLEAHRAAAPAGALVTDQFERFMATSLDVVLEGAGGEAVRQYGERVLDAGVDLIASSVGALVDDALRGRLIETAAQRGARLLIPSGAMAAFDAIQGAAVGRVDRIVMITRKPPRSWRGTYAEQVVDLDKVTEPVVLYEGVPRESARLFPQNVNVQAAVALAGIGLDRTQVKVIADPGIETNSHELLVEGEFGRMHLTIDINQTPENPKTSKLTIFSLIKTLRNLQSPCQVGV